MQDTILRVRDLSVGVCHENNVYSVVDHISFRIRRGEIVGIVGESGCGKSVTALTIQGLIENDIRVLSGKIIFDGEDLLKMSPSERRKRSSLKSTMIFQEPMTSLNPLMKIEKQVGEVLYLQGERSKKEMRKEVRRMLEEVGIQDTERIMKSYPFQLSGGLRQRIMIAMAAICKPQLLIADEPTTALDVTTQAQVLALLKRINREYGTAILFISHDLGVIRQLCDRTLVMYAGKIVEEGSAETILIHPVHEYTKGLINSIPTKKQKGKKLKCIKDRVPSVFEEKMPCPFAPRCEKAKDICFLEVPERKSLSSGHSVCCHLDDLDSEMEYYRI